MGRAFVKMLCRKLGDEATRSVYIFTGHPFADHMDNRGDL